MRLSAAMTADSLIRALRALAHDLAEQRETGYAPPPTRREGRTNPNGGRRDEETGDDRRGS